MRHNEGLMLFGSVGSAQLLKVRGCKIDASLHAGVQLRANFFDPHLSNNDGSQPACNIGPDGARSRQ